MERQTTDQPNNPTRTTTARRLWVFSILPLPMVVSSSSFHGKATSLLERLTPRRKSLKTPFRRKRKSSGSWMSALDQCYRQSAFVRLISLIEHGRVRHYLSPDIKVRRGDVLSAWSGIRPLVRDPAAKNTQSLVRNHMINTSESGLLTIAGGKWTT